MPAIQVNMTGPLFGPQAARYADEFMLDAEEAVGQELENEIRQELRHVLRHPTGYYESRIGTRNVSDRVVVDDGGVVYGPWLEGTGSRNKTTRFKGYATFRRVLQRVQNRVGDIVELKADRFVGKLNGE